MTEDSKRYLELLHELEWRRATSGDLSRAMELAYAGELDRLWIALSEIERDEIEATLVAGVRQQQEA